MFKIAIKYAKVRRVETLLRGPNGDSSMGNSALFSFRIVSDKFDSGLSTVWPYSPDLLNRSSEELDRRSRSDASAKVLPLLGKWDWDEDALLPKRELMECFLSLSND